VGHQCAQRGIQTSDGSHISTTAHHTRYTDGPQTRDPPSTLFPALFALACTPTGTGADTAGTTSTTHGTTVPALDIPQWAWRHWVWEDESTQDSVIEMVDGYRDRDIDVAAVVIDSPWETAYNDFAWDKTRFPDPQALVDELHARDIRLVLWITPAINVDAGDLYTTWANNGWFMQTDADSGPAVVNWWKGKGSLVDYWNPDAVDAWHALMQPVLDLGIDGWKTDGLDIAAVIANYSPGQGASVTRSDYSAAYYGDFFSHTREALGDDRLIMSRPIDSYGADIGGDAVAFTPREIAWAAWVGDQDATFDGLRMALRNFYWSADYGYLGFGSDIGGYRDEDKPKQGRTKDVFLRWAQLGAFSPVMENGGGGDHWPWKWDDETTEIYRGLVDLHHAMLPWLLERGAIAQSEDRSLMTFLDDQDYAYLLGDDVLVAPVLTEDGTVSVSFPKGRQWRWLFGDGSIQDGGQTLKLTMKLDEFPAYVAVGSSADGAF